MSENLHKFFYKDYFEEGIKPSGNITRLNRKLTGLTPKDIGEVEKVEYVNADFKMKVCYPGMITGVGVSHEMGVEGEIKLGINFDYTHGTPIISGSTVKGVLRSYFPQVYDLQNPDINAAILDIFEGKKPDGSTKSIYERDIFFDASVVRKKKKNEERKTIFEMDALAPHSQDDPFKEPIPITFAKIAPGCTIEFRFHLSGEKECRDKKEEWFKKILTTYGIGAKTNVGYGRLEELKEVEPNNK